MMMGRASDGGRTAHLFIAWGLSSSAWRSLRVWRSWLAVDMRFAVDGVLIDGGDVWNSCSACRWIGIACGPSPVNAMMVGRVSSVKTKFRASWWKDVIMELLNAFSVRMTVDGDWARVAIFAIFSLSLLVFWKMLIIFSLIPSSWWRWGCWVRNVDHFGEIMMLL